MSETFHESPLFWHSIWFLFSNGEKERIENEERINASRQYKERKVKSVTLDSSVSLFIWTWGGPDFFGNNSLDTSEAKVLLAR